MNDPCITVIICVSSIVGSGVLTSICACFYPYCKKSRNINSITPQPPPYEESPPYTEQPTLDILLPVYTEQPALDMLPPALDMLPPDYTEQPLS